MNPFSFGDDPAITKKCPHCDTALEFESAGSRVVFTAHDDGFCRDMTRERVRMLQRALLSQRETYEHHMAHYKRRVNEMLAKHGIPSLEEQGKRAEAEAMLMAHRLGLKTSWTSDIVDPKEP